MEGRRRAGPATSPPPFTKKKKNFREWGRAAGGAAPLSPPGSAVSPPPGPLRGAHTHRHTHTLGHTLRLCPIAAALFGLPAAAGGTKRGPLSAPSGSFSLRVCHGHASPVRKWHLISCRALKTLQHPACEATLRRGLFDLIPHIKELHSRLKG